MLKFTTTMVLLRALTKLRSFAKPHYCIFLAFPIVLHFGFTLRPLERFPGWDLLWADSIVAGKLSLIRVGLAEGEIPAISPYHGLGQNVAGDGPALTPFLSPFTLLVPFLDAQEVMQIRFLFYILMGLAGTYLLLKHVGSNTVLATIVALFYVAIPVQFSNQQYYFTTGFYVLPALMLAVWRYCQRLHWGGLFLTGISAFLAYTATDVFFLIITPVVAAFTALFAPHERKPAWRSRIWTTSKICAVVIASAAFYIIPLYCNLRELKEAGKILQALGLSTKPAMTSVSAFWDFFQYFGIPSYYLPQPSSAIGFYVPVFFLIYISLYCGLVWRAFSNSPARRLLTVALCSAASMLALTFLYYSLPSAWIESGKGILRYHLNLWPFFVILAAGAVASCPLPRRDHIRIVATAGGFAFAIDLLLFCVRRPAPGPDSPAEAWFYVRHDPRFVEGFTAPNAFPIRIMSDMWLSLPVLDLWLPALICICIVLATKSRSKATAALRFGVMALAGAWCVIYIAVHNELRATQQSGWQQIGSTKYHREAHEFRMHNLDKLIPTAARMNYRLLPASADVFRMGRGRNWKFCADTEMQAEFRLKMLFSYRELENPFTAVLYSRFYPGFSPSNYFPPLAENVAEGIGVAKLLGVRYILSADAEIASTQLSEIARLDYPSPPFNETVAGGRLYAYELKDARAIGQFHAHALTLSQKEAVQRLLTCDARVDTLPLSIEPSSLSVSPNIGSEEIATGSAEIVFESLNQLHLQVDAPTPGFVSIANLHRRFWSATVNSTPSPVHRANGFMMAVEVPPGRSMVTMKYTPWDVYIGYTITLVTLIGLGVLTLLARRRRADLKQSLSG